MKLLGAEVTGMFSPFCKGFTRNITRLSQRGWCSFWCWTFLSHLQKRFNLLGTGYLRPAALGNWWNITATGGREGLCPDLALTARRKASTLKRRAVVDTSYSCILGEVEGHTAQKQAGYAVQKLKIRILANNPFSHTLPTSL